MKDDWERPEKMHSLNIKQVAGIMESVFPGKKVSSFQPLCNGFSNSNYKVSLEGIPAPFVLRLYSGDKSVAEKELAISKLVRKTVPVADFMHLDASGALLQIPWAILEWKNGTLLSVLMKVADNKDIVSSANSVGETLAEIHKYKFNRHGFLGKNLEVVEPLKMGEEEFLFLIRSFLESRCGAFLGEQLKEELWSFCIKNSFILSESREEPVLVHSDFNGLNILMDNNSGSMAVSAVLDWEFAFSGSIYADIGNMLRYEKEDSDFERHFIEGYLKRGSPLDPDWKTISKLQDLVALCDLLEKSSSASSRRVEDLRRLILNTARMKL